MHNTPTVLAIIPARKGSKGIEGKNMKLLGGKPLIQYTIESALQSRLLTRIAVSSDCEVTAEFAKQWNNVEAPFLRPANFSNDESASIEVVMHAVDFYRNCDVAFDCICLLQPTSPFRNPELIDNTIMHMIKLDADSLITVRQIPEKHNPLWAFRMSSEELHPFLPDHTMPSRRQDLPHSFYRDGKIYLLKTHLLDQNQLMGGKLIGYEANGVDININTMADWELAEIYIEICKKRLNDRF